MDNETSLRRKICDLLSLRQDRCYHTVPSILTGPSAFSTARSDES